MKAAMLQGKHAMSEMAEVGMFMVNTPQECMKTIGGNRLGEVVDTGKEGGRDEWWKL